MAGFTILLAYIALKGMGKKSFIVVWCVGMVVLLAFLKFHITSPLGLTGL